MRYLSAFVAVAGLLHLAVPFAAAQSTTASAGPPTVLGSTVVTSDEARINGTVVTPGGNPVANATVRARNLLTGDIGGSTSTGAAGQFTIDVTQGSYVLEAVDAGGQVIGTSSFVSAAAGTTIPSATVTTTASIGSITASSLMSTLGTTAARSVTYAAAAAGVAGVVTPPNATTASPSR